MMDKMLEELEVGKCYKSRKHYFELFTTPIADSDELIDYYVESLYLPIGYSFLVLDRKKVLILGDWFYEYKILVDNQVYYIEVDIAQNYHTHFNEVC